jgi:hypothetical protein
VDERTARDYLDRGLIKIAAEQPKWRRREDYYRGKQDLPFAPEGVNREYLELREMSPANWLQLAMDTPIQRLRADGFRTGRNQTADQTTWNEVWQPNKLDSRQRIVYTSMVVHGRGLMSVWPNPRDRKQPIIRPESGERVHVEADPEDPFTAKWAVKLITVDDYPGVSSGALWVPGTPGQRGVGFVYDADTWARFERGGNTFSNDWVLTAGGPHPLGDVPFVTFDNRQDVDAKPQSGIEPLMPAQDAINTIRFHVLLAMQFSAFRQRVFTGYDPVVRDSAGNPMWQMADDGVTPLLDSQGLQIPVVRSPGRLGVDRALVFPGEATKVFDLPESNLSNYVTVLGEFLTDLFAVAQVPPQYLLNRMANLSGDALAGAESTLQSLVNDLQRWTGESLEQVMRLANRARGTDEPDLASEVVWADAEARSFAATIDGIVKLISVDFPHRAAWEMIPNATPPKVERWIKLMEEEQKQNAATDPILAAANAFRLPPPSPADASSGASVPQPDATAVAG